MTDEDETRATAPEADDAVPTGAARSGLSAPTTGLLPADHLDGRGGVGAASGDAVAAANADGDADAEEGSDADPEGGGGRTAGVGQAGPGGTGPGSFPRALIERLGPHRRPLIAWSLLAGAFVVYTIL